MQLMQACVLKTDYIRAVTACKKCIVIIDKLTSRRGGKKSTSDQPSSTEADLKKKKKLVIRTFCYYQGGRALFKLDEKHRALRYLKLAWKKATEIFPETDTRIRMYRRKYEKVRNELEFN